MVETNNVNYYNTVPLRAQRPDYPMSGQPQIVPQVIEGAQDSYVVQRAGKIDKDKLTLPATLLAWLGICVGTDYINNIQCNREYGKTPFGKLGAFGDKVTDGYRGSKFAQSGFGQWLHKARINTKTFFREKVVNKSKVLKSMRDNPTEAEWKTARDAAKGLYGWHSADVSQVMTEFMNNIEVPEQLARYGKTKDEINLVKAALKGKSKAERLAFLRKEECKALGLAESASDAVLNDAKAVFQGFANKAEFDNLMSDAVTNGKEIMKRLKNSNEKLCYTAWQGEGRLGWLKKFLGRKVTRKELINKYQLLLDNPAKSKLGRILSKGFGWLMEGATNRFAGGKFAALLQASIIAQILVAVFKAKGAKDKVQTGIERSVNDLSYIVAMPLGAMAVYHAAGARFAGMNANEVKAYHAAREAHNLKADRGAFATRKAWKASKKAVEDMRYKGKGFFTKIFMKLGDILNVGNAQFSPYKSGSKVNLNFLRKFNKWFAKNPLSVVVRGFLVMMVISPFIAKIVTKCSNAIFGKPKHSVLDEDKEEAEAEKAKVLEEQMTALQQDATVRQQASIQHEQQMMNNQNAPRMDLLAQYKHQQLAQQPQIVQPQPVQPQQPVQQTVTTQVVNNDDPNRKYIPSSKGVEIKPEYTYVPSSDGVKLQAPDYSKAEEAMQRSVAVENEVMRVLGQK